MEFQKNAKHEYLNRRMERCLWEECKGYLDVVDWYMDGELKDKLVKGLSGSGHLSGCPVLELWPEMRVQLREEDDANS